MIEGAIRTGGVKGLSGELPGHVHFGIQGPTGGHYIPTIKQTGGQTAEISFTPSQEDMPPVAPVEIELPVGTGEVNLTDYAKEQWVNDNYQPKGNYLTKVPDEYAKKSDIPEAGATQEQENQIQRNANDIALLKNYGGNAVFYMSQEVEWPEPETDDGGIHFTASYIKKQSLSNSGVGVKTGDMIVASNGTICKVTSVSSIDVGYEPIGTINGVIADGGTAGYSIYYVDLPLESLDPTYVSSSKISNSGAGIKIGDIVIFSNGTLCEVTEVRYRDDGSSVVLCVPKTNIGGTGSGGNVDLTGVVKSVNGQTPDENGNVEIAVSGGGLSATASALLINILRNAMYTADQRANITALENALFNGGTAPDVPDEPDVPVVTTYTIVNVLTNVTNSNSTAKVSEGASYIGKLTAADGFNMSTVTVTMGGVDVTADVYADGTITIESVTGNVIITASAVDDSATAPAFQLTSPLVLGDTTDPRINDTANNYVVTGETINDDEDWTICIDFASLTGANPPSKPIVQNGNKQFQIFYDATFWHIAAHGKYIGHNMLIDHSEGKLAGKNLVEVITYNSATKTYSGYGTVENTLTFDSFTTAAGGAVFINCSNAVGTVNRFALYKRVLSADEITEWIGG